MVKFRLAGWHPFNSIIAGKTSYTGTCCRVRLTIDWSAKRSSYHIQGTAVGLPDVRQVRQLPQRVPRVYPFVTALLGKPRRNAGGKIPLVTGI